MSLDQLAEALGDEEEEDDGLEDDDESIVHVNDDQVADTQAMIQEMEIKEDDVDMDSGDEDAAANRASHVQIQPVKEPLPSTEKVASFSKSKHMQLANYFCSINRLI